MMTDSESSVTLGKINTALATVSTFMYLDEPVFREFREFLWKMGENNAENSECKTVAISVKRTNVLYVHGRNRSKRQIRRHLWQWVWRVTEVDEFTITSAHKQVQLLYNSTKWAASAIKLTIFRRLHKRAWSKTECESELWTFASIGSRKSFRCATLIS